MAKKFHVVKMEGKNAIPVLANGVPQVYDAGMAKAWADHYTKLSGVKHQPRPIYDVQDANWREREMGRFKDGSYIRVPWHNAHWVKKNKECKEHFVHVSANNPANIAFTANEEKGLADRQTVMSPTKYLSRYYDGIISEKVRRRWLAMYRKMYGSDYDFHIAKKAKEIVEVYAKGPGSCMHGCKAVSAYEGPDLAVAYITRKGEITARAVVWPKKKLYYNSYGDIELMEEVLKEKGYKQGRLVGARLTVKKDRYGSRILPSVDSAHYGFDYQGKYAIIK